MSQLVNVYFIIKRTWNIKVKKSNNLLLQS